MGGQRCCFVSLRQDKESRSFSGLSLCRCHCTIRAAEAGGALACPAAPATLLTVPWMFLAPGDHSAPRPLPALHTEGCCFLFGPLIVLLGLGALPSCSPSPRNVGKLHLKLLQGLKHLGMKISKRKMWAGIKEEEGQILSLREDFPSAWLCLWGFWRPREQAGLGHLGLRGPEALVVSLFLGLAWTNCLVLLGASVSPLGVRVVFSLFFPAL